MHVTEACVQSGDQAEANNHNCMSAFCVYNHKCMSAFCNYNHKCMKRVMCLQPARPFMSQVRSAALHNPPPAPPPATTRRH